MPGRTAGLLSGLLASHGLRELAVWGFHDCETNIHMLEAFGGNVQAALLQLQQLG